MRSLRQTPRRKTDIYALSVALFAMVGGFIVFRSFAHSGVDTVNPGTVEVQKIRVQDTNNQFEFSLEKNLTYCFVDKGIPSGGAAIKVLEPAKIQSQLKRVSEDTVKGELYCFTADKAYSNVRIQLIAKDLNSVTSLTIR